MANRNFPNGGKIYSMETQPVLIDCNFVVDSTNGNGLGIRNLKGPYVDNVFMYTTASPGRGTNGVLNPDPQAGVIVVQLKGNYNRSLSGIHSIVSPVSGTALQIDNSALTAGVAYVITTLGNSTQATWTALGVPRGITPAVGVSFIASGNGGSADVSTSRVMATAVAGSGIETIETVGDPNMSIAPNPTANQGFGAQLILQCRNSSGANAAPADGTVISLGFLLNNSGNSVQGG